MSSKWIDFPNSAKTAMLQNLTALTQSLTSATQDFVNGDGLCAAFLFLGAVSGSGGPTLDVTIQESADGTTWTEVIGPDGTTAGTFAQRTTSNQSSPEAKIFQRQSRYLRAKQVVGGTTSPNFTAGVMAVELYKTSGGT